VKNSLMQLGVRSADGGLDVYRDGQVVTLVARGSATRETEHGQVRTQGIITQQYDTVEAYEADRKELLERFPLAYTNIVTRLGIRDDVRKAPRLPQAMKGLLPKRLPPGMSRQDVERADAESTDVEVRSGGSTARPFLALLEGSKP